MSRKLDEWLLMAIVIQGYHSTYNQWITEIIMSFVYI